MGEIVAGIAATFEMTATLRYERRYPATINSPEETRHALAAAVALVGADNVRHRSDAGDGVGGFRVHAAGEARLLHLARRRPRAGHAEPRS